MLEGIYGKACATADHVRLSAIVSDRLCSTKVLRLTVKQKTAPTQDVARVGQKLFLELAVRKSTSDEEARLYRHAIVSVADKAGINVPDFVREAEDAGVDGWEQRLAETRAWVASLLKFLDFDSSVCEVQGPKQRVWPGADSQLQLFEGRK